MIRIDFTSGLKIAAKVVVNEQMLFVKSKGFEKRYYFVVPGCNIAVLNRNVDTLNRKIAVLDRNFDA
jgi:hypothetical protein